MMGYPLLALGAVLIGGAWLARASWPLDAKLLLLCALMAIGHALAWQLPDMQSRSSSMTPSLALLVGPQMLYLAGFGSGIWFFCTKMRGWLRVCFLLFSIAALLPVIALVIFAVLYLTA